MRTLRIIMCLAMAVLPLQTSAIKAQEVPLIRPGDRVRVTAPECELEKAEGTLLSIGNDRFSATVGKKDIQCPVQALTQLEVSLGERKWWKATLVGLGIGIGVGAIGVAVIWEDELRKDSWTPNYAPAIMWTMGWITVGAVTGSEIGRRRGRDQWKEIPLPVGRFSMLRTPSRQLCIGLSIPVGR
jgi:hypothetical protein